MARIHAWLALLLLGSGCATVPFPPVATPAPDEAATAAAWREAAAATQPQRFAVSGSVVFEYRRRGMAGIGITRIDEPARFLSVVALTPLGMKLFEIETREGRVERAILAPGLDAHGDPTAAIAKDIERVYFNRVPSPGAAARRCRRGFEFTEPAPDGGRLEYLLGGSPPVPVEKRFRDRRGLVWKASYHLYRERNGRLHPGGILYEHRRHGYRLVLRMNEILEEPPRNGYTP